MLINRRAIETGNNTPTTIHPNLKGNNAANKPPTNCLSRKAIKLLAIVSAGSQRVLGWQSLASLYGYIISEIWDIIIVVGILCFRTPLSQPTRVTKEGRKLNKKRHWSQLDREISTLGIYFPTGFLRAKETTRWEKR